MVEACVSLLRGVPLKSAKSWFGLWAIVHAEDALHNAFEIFWNVDGSGSPAELAVCVLVSL